MKKKQINNNMQLLSNSKVKFVSVSQLLALALWSLFGSVSCPYTAQGFISYTWGKKSLLLTLNMPRAKGVLLVFLDATSRGGLGFAFFFSCGSVRMGARSGLQYSRLTSFQPRLSVCCQAPTVHLCQTDTFNPPVVQWLGATHTPPPPSLLACCYTLS